MSVRDILKDELERIDLYVDEDTIALLLRYHKFILHWNRKINIISRQEEDIIGRHILDSLSIHNLIHGNHMLDFGSGAGFPGIPLRIVLKKLHLDIIESRQKKATFLKLLKNELGLKDVNIYNTDIAQFHPKINYDVITARKVGDIKKVVKLTSRFLEETGRIITFKGERLQEEIEEAREILDKQRLSIVKRKKRLFMRGEIVVIGRIDG